LDSAAIMSETKVRLRHRFASLKAWELSPEPATFASSNKWSNKDMDVVPGLSLAAHYYTVYICFVLFLISIAESKRTWGTLSWCWYWLSDALNVASYELASSMIAIGLSW
jgi:NCS1 family nucleobase:cation symporter-1